MTGLQYWYNLECDLYVDKRLTNEQKINRAWSILDFCRANSEIDWDDERKIFGEFCANLFRIKPLNERR